MSNGFKISDVVKKKDWKNLPQATKDDLKAIQRGFADIERRTGSAPTPKEFRDALKYCMKDGISADDILNDLQTQQRAARKEKKKAASDWKEKNE